MAFDPIITFLTDSRGCDASTYVDDLAALLIGAAMAIAAQLVLAVVGRWAGLETEVHKCRTLAAHDAFGDAMDARG